MSGAADELNDVLQRIIAMGEAARTARDNDEEGVAQAAVAETVDLALGTMPEIIRKLAWRTRGDRADPEG